MKIYDFTTFLLNVWIFWTFLNAKIHFYFILNKKCRSFLKFWAHFQFGTTTYRCCGCLGSLQRNLNLAVIHAFWCIWTEMWKIEEISNETRFQRFCRITTCDPAMESFLRELSESKKKFVKKIIFCFLELSAAVYGPARNIRYRILLSNKTPSLP